MGIEIVNNYKVLVNNIGRLIEISGYRNDYVARKIGLTPANFAAKKKRASLSTDEIGEILKVIENEDVEDYLMLEIMRSREGEETIGHEEFLEEVAKWK